MSIFKLDDIPRGEEEADALIIASFAQTTKMDSSNLKTAEMRNRETSMMREIKI